MFVEGINFMKTAKSCGLSQLWEPEIEKIDALSQVSNEIKTYDEKIQSLESRKQKFKSAVDELHLYHQTIMNNIDYQASINHRAVVRSFATFNKFCEAEITLYDQFIKYGLHIDAHIEAKPNTQERIKYLKDKIHSLVKVLKLPPIEQAYFNNYELHLFMTEADFMSMLADWCIADKSYLYILNEDKENIFKQIALSATATVIKNTIDSSASRGLFVSALENALNTNDKYNMHSFVNDFVDASIQVRNIIGTIPNDEVIQQAEIYDNIYKTQRFFKGCLKYCVSDSIAALNQLSMNPLIRTFSSNVFRRFEEIDTQTKELNTEIDRIDNFINELKQQRQQFEPKYKIYKQVQHQQQLISQLEEEIKNEDNTHEQMLLTAKVIVHLDELRKLIHN